MPQSNSLDFKLVQRVCLLQQALDQALESLAEMNAQVQSKQWVETQLASTEKYANVQQQAVAQLRQHVEQFTQVQRRLLNVMAYRLNGLIDQQQIEFNRLHIQVQRSEAELQSYLQYLQHHCHDEHRSETPIVALNAEVMVARAMTVSLSNQLKSANQSLGNLSLVLDNHHLNLNQIIQTIRGMVTELSFLGTGTNESMANQSPTPWRCLDPAESPDAHQDDTIALQDALHRQALHINELNTALLQQFQQHTRLKHRCQRLSAERDYYKRQLEKIQNESARAQAVSVEGTPFPLGGTGRRQQPPKAQARSHPPSPIQPLKLRDDPE